MDPWHRIAHLSGADIRSLQNAKLKTFINSYIYPFSRYYRKLFDDHKINPKDIRTVDDLRRIPLTSKLDFIETETVKDRFREFILQPTPETIRAHWPPQALARLALTKIIKGKDHLENCMNREFRPVFMTFTTGTTNKPVPFVYSNYDMDNLNLSGARMLRLFNIRIDERIVNMFPYAPHLAFWQVVAGGLASNALILSTGGGKVMSTEGNVQSLLKMRPSVILGVPSFIYHVLRVAKEKGCRLDFIRIVVLGASRITIAFKQKLVELLQEMGAENVAVFGTYGFTEARTAWAECPTQITVSSGYHLYPDKEIFEVVDPKTGEIKGEGEDGELVYTSLDSRGSSVIRYRTGDFVKGGIRYEPCPHCHRRVPRIASDISRFSDVKNLQLSKIKGSLVNLDNFSCALSEVPSVVEWQIELKKKDDDPYEVDELIVYAALAGSADEEKAKEDIINKMLITTEVKPNAVYILPLDVMVRRLELETSNKEKRIIDLRPTL